MGLKGRANLDAARETARAAFDDVLQGRALGTGMLLAESYKTGTSTDNALVAQAQATIREWIGEKHIDSLEAFKQAVVLTKYEHTLSLDRFDLIYEQPEILGRAVRGMISSAMTAGDDKIVFDSLTSASGDGPTCFSGDPMFSTSHTLSGTTYVNKTTSALSVPTYDTAYATMTKYASPGADPMLVRPTHLIVGPDNRKQAFEIANVKDRHVALDAGGLESGTRVAATSIGNVFSGDGIDVIVWERLAGTQANYWYLADLSKESKPLFVKNERDWELIEQTDMDSPQRFSLDKFVWSVEADKKVSPAMFLLMYAGIL